MDVSFNIHNLLKEEITLVDKHLQPCKQHGVDRYGFQQLQQMLYEVINKMGDASAKAQGLHGSITTGKKLENSNHHLYIMKDVNANGGQCSTVGILKVGQKKLFVYDHCKVQHEMEPLCILDFYVHESRQRTGCGRKLFDFMLRREGIAADHLAIDRPSPKFLSFLRKHYHLKSTIPQVNNFVIFDNFFSNCNSNSGRGRGSYNNRVSPMRPLSGQRTTHSPFSERSQTQVCGGRRQPSPSAERSWTPRQARQSPSHMGAGDMMYSRHRATPPMQGNITPNSGPQHLRNGARTPTRGYNTQYHQQQQYIQQQEQQHSRYPNQHQQRQQQHNYQEPWVNTDTNDNISFYKKLNSYSSPSTYYNTGTSPARFGQGAATVGNNVLEHLPPKPLATANTNPRVVPASTPNFGSRGGPETKQNNILPSVYPTNNHQLNVFGSHGHQNMGITANNTQPLLVNDFSVTPGADSKHDIHKSSSNQENVIIHRPPSGKQNNPNNRRAHTSQPPLLQREGPPSNYKEMLNMHQTYQGRNGRLNVPDGSSAMPAANSPYSRIENQNTSWTVAGVLREQRINQPLSNRHYSSTRLW